MQPGLGIRGQSRKPHLGTPGTRTDLPKAELEVWDSTLKLGPEVAEVKRCQVVAKLGRLKAAGPPGYPTLCPSSCLRRREGEGAGPQGQGVVAEDRVDGGADAAGIPTGRGVGSKGQAEV